MLEGVPRTLKAFLSLTLLLAGCNTASTQSKEVKKTEPYGPGPATSSSKHPLAKYIELSGFRVSESGAGKLKIKFAAINHSAADMGELMVKVRLVTTATKPGEPPVTEFEAKIPPLGPEEVRDVTATATTTLRLYELPDWQFLRADFDITAPAP